MTATISRDIAAGARIIRAGGVVAFPTETVYGLGANALDAEAVARVFEIKGRPRFDPLIVHIADSEGVRDLVTEFPETARALGDRFWPGPLTLVLPKRPAVPDLVTAGLSTVGIRVPDHPVARELIELSGVPIAAPSANLFGRVSPTTAHHVAEQLGPGPDLILDGGPCRVGVESTVVLVGASEMTVLRPGGVPIEELEAVAGPVRRGWEPGSSGASPAPGMLPQHYATQTRLVLVNELSSAPRGPGIALLSFGPITRCGDLGRVEVLSETGDLRVAAANLFAALRRLDASGAELIVAQRVPDEGLGRAINNRLERAAAAFAPDAPEAPTD